MLMSPNFYIAFLQILKGLASSGRRAVPLIKSMVYYLSRKTDLNDIKLISDAFYAASNLAIKDLDFLEALSNKFEATLSTLEATHHSDSVVRSIITSFGQLGFCSKKALNSISSWYAQRLQQEPPVGTKDLAAFVLTTGAVNYVPIGSEPLYKVSGLHLFRVNL